MMNPHDQFCPNPNCSARGQVGAGNIQVHSPKERRYRCRECGQTFSESKGTALYQVKKPRELFVLVTTLLAYGCPVQAVVAAFGLDERTVRAWWGRAGDHCQAVHEAVIGKSQLDLEQVQADEIKVKTQQGTVWMAMAMMVRTRLWLGGVVSPQRDLALIVALVACIRAIAMCRPLLLAVDGLSSYVRAFQDSFRSPLPRRTCGRPRLVAWRDIAIVQVVKHRAAELDIERRIVQGCPTLVARLVQVSQGVGGINTAFIERLNATFRQRLACLTRRSRALARSPQTLLPIMFLVGTVYNFCTFHQSLRLPLLIGSHGHRHWVQRTPALAAGLTDHRWSVLELLTFKIPPPPWVPPKRRGRPPKSVLAAAL
jgi:transposase-like protein